MEVTSKSIQGEALKLGRIERIIPSLKWYTSKANDSDIISALNLVPVICLNFVVSIK